MSTLARFDPWAELERLRCSPATVATAATRHPAVAGLAGVAGSRGPDRSTTNDVVTDLPAPWWEALAKLEEMKCPPAIPAERWSRAVLDARYLVTEWGLALVSMGWQIQDLFAVHPEAPLARYDCMGLTLLLRGCRVGPIDGPRIKLHTRSGSIMSFGRLTGLPAEAVMLWDLKGQAWE